MLTRRALIALPAAAAGVVLAPRAFAEPTAGAPFPSFAGRDLNDAQHASSEWRGRRVFVTIITDTGAAEPMRGWLNDAEARLGRARGNIYALVALSLGFYAWDGVVRSRARAGTPQWRWPNVWLDRGGAMQRALGVPDGSRAPWACVVEGNGTVSAMTHAPPTHASAQAVWAAMMA